MLSLLSAELGLPLTILLTIFILIIAYSLLSSFQRNQAGSSLAMEFLGFQQCMKFLLGFGILITTFISDKHVSIGSHIRNVLKNIVHYFDIWHLKKSKFNL